MRIENHPILPPEGRRGVTITFDGRELVALEAETIAAALFANGIRTFGYHPRDGAPLGIFCANGQCAQCLVVASGRPVKACMTPVVPGMVIEPLRGLPRLPKVSGVPELAPISSLRVAVLIIGGGPAGMSGAIQLGQHGIKTLLIDDKDRLGGKLVLQTHRFFGSTNAVYAGTRGIDIAQRLESQVRGHESVTVWLNSTALAVYSDGKVGVLREGREYVLVEPQVLLVAAGAREKSLAFRGNTLPGVYGAGAFQTLVNRDRVKAADRLFIVGGGNVGLIAGYHALQAGIQVVGLCEALPECGGYKVHRDKLVRLGVPILTSHTILSANGSSQVESVTIARVDENWLPVPGTERSFPCDTVLIAVGLDPIQEFTQKATEYGLPVYAAGDAEEIAEASAAMFSGKIRGLEIAALLGGSDEPPPAEWLSTAEILRSRPGEIHPQVEPGTNEGVVPILHCTQEIPCDPCTSVCPQGLIAIDPTDIRTVPRFLGEALGERCIGCEKCLTVCPGLAITLVDYRKDSAWPVVMVPMEFGALGPKAGDVVTVLNVHGEVLGQAEVVSVRSGSRSDRTSVVRLRVPGEWARQVAGIRLQQPWVAEPLPEAVERLTDDTIVCRCERVTAAELRSLIRQGYRDMNEIKSITRAGMGACGGKTCELLIRRLFREEGIRAEAITLPVRRPLYVEVPLGVLAGARDADRG